MLFLLDFISTYISTFHFIYLSKYFYFLKLFYFCFIQFFEIKSANCICFEFTFCVMSTIGFVNNQIPLSWRIMAEPYSAIIAVAGHELALITCGMIEPSTTRSLFMFITLNLASTTALRSCVEPHRHVPTIISEFRRL